MDDNVPAVSTNTDNTLLFSFWAFLGFLKGLEYIAEQLGNFVRSSMMDCFRSLAVLKPHIDGMGGS